MRVVANVITQIARSAPYIIMHQSGFPADPQVGYNREADAFNPHSSMSGVARACVDKMSARSMMQK